MLVSYLAYSSNPEDGDEMLPRNAGSLSVDYTALYLKR
jgi:hypothetical protein